MKLTDLTPSPMLCMVAACPRIYATDRDTYIVIGHQLSTKDLRDIPAQIGPNEIAVEVPKALVDNAMT